MNRKKLLASPLAVAVALFGQGNLINAAEVEAPDTAAVTEEVVESPRSGLTRNWVSMRITANNVHLRSTAGGTSLGLVQSGNIGAVVGGDGNANCVQLQMISGPNVGRTGWVNRKRQITTRIESSFQSRYN
ncbi:MAG: hypothetical protein FWF59_05990 [Turicibacter sp.]|nr:hypothetical protein [Turicibacter sp.]